ncbi:uncharacterized protein LY79DRAFT_179632 [Colletotrichum navitas]|uniref:Uncharacterized protein n=1 Tax=Colletotrichum navitas TaxID=681940 RepID=A0AAD8V5L7_9PEZI|nr:uncharacterized protein LY79DRAFT_179632 [Colletotrichum navitas]KAK1593493.1 hypothetical protein LY79DRAFT_179632 [Colletotrichum navitas]
MLSRAPSSRRKPFPGYRRKNRLSIAPRGHFKPTLACRKTKARLSDDSTGASIQVLVETCVEWTAGRLCSDSIARISKTLDTASVLDRRPATEPSTRNTMPQRRGSKSMATSLQQSTA